MNQVGDVSTKLLGKGLFSNLSPVGHDGQLCSSLREIS